MMDVTLVIVLQREGLLLALKKEATMLWGHPKGGHMQGYEKQPPADSQQESGALGPTTTRKWIQLTAVQRLEEDPKIQKEMQPTDALFADL